MDRRASRRIAVIVLGLLGLVALALGTRRLEGLRLFSPLEPNSLRSAVLKNGRQAVRRERFPGLRSPLVIQQIGLADPDGPVRCDGMPSDWIELLNRSGRDVSLAGFALSDGPAPSRRWTFPDVALPAGESIVVWADGRDRVGSRWESRDPVRRPRQLWERRPDEDSAAGYVFRSARSPDLGVDPELGYQIEVPAAGGYDLWLRCRAEGEAPCRLEIDMDGQVVEAVLARPSRRFQTLQLQPPRPRASGWKREAGPVPIRIRLKQGEVSVDRLVLTRRDRPFGRGDQDFHAPFKLKAAGETISLHAPRGIPLDVVQFPALAAGETYRRIPRGRGDFAVAAQAAPDGGAPLPAPVFSAPSGFVPSGSVVSIQGAWTGGVVRFTTDGSLPDEDSPAWSDQIVREPSIFTVRGFREGAAPSRSATRVYHPGPPGDVPLVWCVLRPDAETRLLRYRLARGSLSEQRAHLCILFPDGTAQSADVAIRPQGRSSRLSKIKQAYRIVCREALGGAFWPGDVFGGEGGSRQGSFVLNATSLIKHPVALDAMRAHGFVAPRLRHVLFRINRDPMGVYMLFEDPNDPEYWRQAFGHLDLDVIKVKTRNPVKAGDDRAFNATWNSFGEGRATSPEAFGRWMDPAYFMRWVALHQLLGITDNQQGYFVRDRRKTQAPWSFIIWDLDGALSQAIPDERFLWTTIEGSRKAVLARLMEDEAGARLCRETALTLAGGEFDAERWSRRAEEYGDIVLRHLDDDWAGRAFQGVLEENEDRGRLEEIYRQAIVDVRRFLARQPGLYRESLVGR